MAKYFETETIELKERYTDVLAREIVSFLNTDGGTIFIGVRDDGAVVGVENTDEVFRKLSDVITDQIEPNPQEVISTEVTCEDGKIVIAVKVKKGSEHLYCRKKLGFSPAGCTMRIGTTVKEMTNEQIKSRYEQKFFSGEYMLRKRSLLSNMTFRELKVYYLESGFHIDDRSFEMNLGLKTPMGEYNLLAELLSDKNTIPLVFAKFQGTTKATISEHCDYGTGCLLTSYAKIRTRLSSENMSISDTSVRPRKDSYLFDLDAANEAVLNALVHNSWILSEPQVSLFSNRLEILSHGGLPEGMTEKAFFDGISRPRNPALMRIFLSLGLTEHTGHGIPLIISRYGKEAFEIESNYIRCTIPFDEEVMRKIGKDHRAEPSKELLMNRTEKRVVSYLIDNPSSTAYELAETMGVSERTVERTFRSLKEKQLIERIGSKRDGNWLVVK